MNMLGSMILVAFMCIALFECAPQTESCSNALAKVEALLKKEPKILGLETPRCHTDGTYLGMQYGGSQAICVTPDGIQIPNFSVNRWETGPDMHCKCARDQHENQKLNMVGITFNCATNGNYAAYGCTGSVCYCQDSYGNKVGTNTVPISEVHSINC